MNKDLRNEVINDVYANCPHNVFEYANHHKLLFNGMENRSYFRYTDYAMWLTAMGLLETLELVDEKAKSRIIGL